MQLQLWVILPWKKGVFLPWEKSHGNHSGEQIVIHQGRKSVTLSGNKKIYLNYSRRRKICGLKIDKNFSRGLGDFLHVRYN